MGVHGVREYPLRAEIALFSDNGLTVVGSKHCLGILSSGGYLTTSIVKSYLKLKDLPNSGLRIETREPASAASLQGRRLSSNEAAYPGLPLFQQSSFDSHQEGEKVICDSIELKFLSIDARGINLPKNHTGDLC
jgi:hypothetical protein